jgi:hypothetical protein
MLDILKTDMKAIITGNTIGTDTGGNINTTTTIPYPKCDMSPKNIIMIILCVFLVSARPTTIKINIQHHDFGGAISR